MVFNTKAQDISKHLVEGEEIISQLDTVFRKEHGRVVSQTGVLVITSQRVLFLQRSNLVKKVIKALARRESESWELVSQLVLNHVNVKSGGFVNKYLSINGERYYLAGISIKEAVETIRNAVSRARSVDTRKVALEPTTSRDAPAVAVHVPDLYCSACGKDNSRDAVFCTECGARL